MITNESHWNWEYKWMICMWCVYWKMVKQQQQNTHTHTHRISRENGIGRWWSSSSSMRSWPIFLNIFVVVCCLFDDNKRRRATILLYAFTKKLNNFIFHISRMKKNVCISWAIVRHCLKFVRKSKLFFFACIEFNEKTKDFLISSNIASIWFFDENVSNQIFSFFFVVFNPKTFIKEWWWWWWWLVEA